MLKTVDFPGVEIFAVGTWNKNKFTLEDLKTLAASYAATKGVFSVPIKLGHNDAQKLLDDAPAAGWVENVRVVGSKLVADFKKVPATVGQLIESGAFRKRSVEINKEFKIGSTTYPMVLTGLALLGSQLPAVDTLEDIVALYEREEIEAEDASEKYVFAEAEETFDELMSAFDEFYSLRVERFFKGRPGAPTLRQLHRAFKEGLQRANKVTHSKETEVEDKRIRELLGLDDEADIEEALKAAKKGKPAEHNKDDDETKAELSKLTGDFLKLQLEVATGKANAAVDAAIADAKLLPAQRETALKMALRDLDEFLEFIKVQPSVVELGERGKQGKDDGNFSRFEPTKAETDAAKMLGITPDTTWRISLMREKASREGIEIPADFGKVPA